MEGERFNDETLPRESFLYFVLFLEVNPHSHDSHWSHTLNEHIKVLMILDQSALGRGVCAYMYLCVHAHAGV